MSDTSHELRELRAQLNKPVGHSGRSYNHAVEDIDRMIHKMIEIAEENERLKNVVAETTRKAQHGCFDFYCAECDGTKIGRNENT